MVRRCIVCKTPQSNSSISLHRFPKSEEKRRVWLESCNLNESDYREWWVLCSKHFGENDYDATNWPTKVLLKSAVPIPTICDNDFTSTVKETIGLENNATQLEIELIDNEIDMSILDRETDETSLAIKNMCVDMCDKEETEKPVENIESKLPPDPQPSEKRIYCKYCDKHFTFQSNLNRHLYKIHGIMKRNIISHEFNMFLHKCLECRLSYINIEQLRHHLSDRHKMDFTEQHLEFKSVEEFNDWLMEICSKNSTQYVAQQTSKGQDFHTVYYYCNRTGSFRTKPPTARKRKIKSQGSCKIGSACTSTIRMRKNIKTGVCSVKYIPLHYGHATELEHVRLPRISRVKIAEKLAEGVPASRILESTRVNISPDELKRTDLLTKMDIANIKHSLKSGINEGVRHPLDNVSVELWADEYAQNETNTIFYKKQGDPHEIFNDNDFCLIFMNALQENMLETYGNNGIIHLDTTDGLRGFEFELSTILVTDECEEGFPTACMFSNRNDSEAFTFFCNKIKEKLGVITAKTVVSDTSNVFYNAWKTVMGPVQHHVFSPLHVNQAWRHSLEKIVDKEKRETVYRDLKVLESETEENTFVEQLKRFKEMLNEDQETVRFGKYFNKNFANRCKQWAYAYRESAGIDTNMTFQPVQNYIKYFRNHGSLIRRLDKAIHAVNTYIREQIVDRMVEDVNGTSTYVAAIEKIHEVALTSIFDVTVEKNLWQVKTGDGKIYNVSKNRVENLSCCELNCVSCESCIHAYSCTCIDYFVEATICKHIHYVNIFNKNPEEVQIVDCQASENDVDTNFETDSEGIELHYETEDTSNVKEFRPARTILKDYCLKVVKLDLTDVDDSTIKHALECQRNIFNLLRHSAYLKMEGGNYEPPKKRKCSNSYVEKNKTVDPTFFVEPTDDQSSMIKSALLSEEFILTGGSEEHNYYA